MSYDPQDRNRGASQAEQILSALQAAGRDGLTNQDLSQISLKYTGRISDLRKQGHQIVSTRIEGGLFRYVLEPEDKPGYSPHSEHVTYEPPGRLPVGYRGRAMVVAAFALEALSGERQRLHWCVDLKRDVGPDADEPINPSAPYPATTAWGQYLHRFRGALDLQPWSGARCKLALTVRHTLKSSGASVLTTFSIPWSAHLPSLCRAAPPVGAWRLFAEPPEIPPDGRGALVGDNLPDSFWHDGIPF